MRTRFIASIVATAATCDAPLPWARGNANSPARPCGGLPARVAAPTAPKATPMAAVMTRANTPSRGLAAH